MKFKLFDMNRDGKGVEVGEDTTPNIKYYFKLLWRKLTKLVSINLIMILQYLPLIFAFLIYFWADNTPSASDISFAANYGVFRFSGEPADFVRLTLTSIQIPVPVITLPMLIGMGALVLLFVVTFGWCNVGFTYLMRELVNGRPVFIFSDFFYAVKKNLKQGFFVGIIDAIILFVLGFDYIYMNRLTNSFGNNVVYFGIIALLIIYLIMRFYIYLMLITFDIKTIKIFKNALIFVPLGIKRNALAIVWVIAIVGINVLLCILYLPLGIVLPLLYVLSVPSFTTAYAAYPIIQKYMIDPQE